MDDGIFDKKTIDKIIEKVKEDSSGSLGRVMQKLMDVSRAAGEAGFSLNELSIMVTTGWYLSQSPELKSFFDQLMKMPLKKDDDVWN
tara:strand:+ start:699 stop:959 length:261 start_codon:yes stop_codon:yes gene_type:complete